MRQARDHFVEDSILDGRFEVRQVGSLVIGAGAIVLDCFEELGATQCIVRGADDLPEPIEAFLLRREVLCQMNDIDPFDVHRYVGEKGSEDLRDLMRPEHEDCGIRVVAERVDEADSRVLIHVALPIARS